MGEVARPSRWCRLGTQSLAVSIALLAAEERQPVHGVPDLSLGAKLSDHLEFETAGKSDEVLDHHGCLRGSCEQQLYRHPHPDDVVRSMWRQHRGGGRVRGRCGDGLEEVHPDIIARPAEPPVGRVPTMVPVTRWESRAAEGRLAAIDAATAPLRAAIAHHRVHELIDDRAAVRVFMEHHVVAVWDFMSLLKALQRELTCVTVPWIPRGDAAHLRFVNELVLAEESDVAPGGGYTSHLELYIGAMREAGADTHPIESLLRSVEAGEPGGVERCGLATAAASFALSTVALAEGGPTHRLAAAFAFGRERLIPEMFSTLRSTAERQQPRLGLLLSYLDRHIELDADEHTPLAFGLVAGLCGDDERLWTEAEETATVALEGRLRLWEAIARAIEAAPGTGETAGTLA